MSKQIIHNPVAERTVLNKGDKVEIVRNDDRVFNGVISGVLEEPYHSSVWIEGSFVGWLISEQSDPTDSFDIKKNNNPLKK